MAHDTGIQALYVGFCYHCAWQTSVCATLSTAEWAAEEHVAEHRERTATDAEQVIAELQHQNWQSMASIAGNLAIPMVRVGIALQEVEAITVRVGGFGPMGAEAVKFGFETRRALNDALATTRSDERDGLETIKFHADGGGA
jgi:hypothetical protein